MAGLVLGLVCTGCDGAEVEVARGAAVPPPPATSRDAAPWDGLARWAAEGYAALGFAIVPEDVRVEVISAGDASTRLDHAAREFALEVLDVGPRTNAETHWILRRAMGIRVQDSPQAELEHEIERAIRSTPLWYDRRFCAVRVVDGHPLFEDPDHAGDADWEPWHLMAHEVAHALQDQRAPLISLSGEGDTYEKHVVHKCLYEGEADLRMLALAAALSGRELRDVDEGWCERELERLFERAAPSYYDAGFRYLFDRLKRGGWEAVEGAVSRADVSSRDLLAWPAGPIDVPVIVALPPWPDRAGDFEYEWHDEVGAWGLLGLLSGDYEAAQPRADDLAELILAWRADRLAVVRRNDGVTVLMWRIVMSDAASAEQLSEYFLGAEGSVSLGQTESGAVLDFAWSPVDALQLAALEALETGR